MAGYDEISHASVTDVGMRRGHNEDTHAVLLAGDAEQWQRQGHVFLVADGMGGHAVGELASELAASIIPHTYHKHAAEGPEAALRKAFIEANASINARGQQNREFHRMGTTSTALVVRPEGAWVGHVGDSRAYRIRDGIIEQLTFDHSLQWELAKRQRVNPDGLQGVASNVIVRSLGPEPLVEVDVEGPHPLRAGDVFVLCSDGLSGQLTNREIGAVASALPPAEACRLLVHLANLRGGPDNITVMVVRVGGTPTAAAPAADGQARVRRPLPRLFWTYGALALGLVMAVAAVYFFLDNQMTGAKVAFGVAVLALLAGLAGLAYDFVTESRRPAEAPPRRRVRAYRKDVCTIDRPLVERMSRAETALRKRAGDQRWDVDWSGQQQHRELAEGHLKTDDLPAAFRELCRAVRPLAEALQKQNPSENGFDGVWERS